MSKGFPQFQVVWGGLLVFLFFWGGIGKFDMRVSKVHRSQLDFFGRALSPAENLHSGSIYGQFFSQQCGFYHAKKMNRFSRLAFQNIHLTIFY